MKKSLVDWDKKKHGLIWKTENVFTDDEVEYIISKIQNQRVTVPAFPSKVVAKIAPIIAIPEIAFEPDINGVCRVGGTFVIISNPTNTAKIKIVIIAISIFILYLKIV